MNKLYFACYVSRNGKYYPFIDSMIIECENAANRFNGYVVAMPCETKKRAVEVVRAWTKQFKAEKRFAIIL